MGWRIDQHLVLGVSLGGHSAWQTMFREERVEAGVVIIGCPDYMGESFLLRRRRRLHAHRGHVVVRGVRSDK